MCSDFDMAYRTHTSFIIDLIYIFMGAFVCPNDYVRLFVATVHFSFYATGFIIDDIEHASGHND